MFSVTPSRISGVSLAYLENSIRRNEVYLVQAVYVRCMCDVSATFLWRICICMKFHFRMYGVSKHMCYVRVTYVWRMKRTRDVSKAYALRSILICGVSVLCVLLPSKMPPKSRPSRLSPKKQR